MDRNTPGIQTVAVVLIIAAAIMLFEPQATFVVLVLMGILFAVWQSSRRNANLNSGGDRRERRVRPPRASWLPPEEDRLAEAERQGRADPVYKHALEAVSRAGLDPNNVQVLPVDIGLMVFRGGEEPVIHRTWPIEDNVDYIQPFVQLRLPTKATGKIRFELIDSQGNTVFVHEDNHQLMRGRNLITPGARLPIHDAHPLDGQWEMRVSADGTLLAAHRFGWEESTETHIRKHIGEDGELSNEIRVALAENRLQKMSLDELLAPQDDDARQQSTRRSS